MLLELVGAPASSLFTVDEVKAYLRIDGEGEDTLVEGLITSATQAVEEYIRRSILTQKWRLSRDKITAGIFLPRPPVQSVDRVTVDGADVGSDSYILVAQGLFYPKVPLVASNPLGVVVEYTAGYGNVPPALKQAVLMLIAHFYEHRGDEKQEISQDVLVILSPFRVAML